MSEQVKLSDVRFAAMNLLAMREHSAKELTEKLGRKFPSPEIIVQVIVDLKEQNLQSDERFAEAFIRMRQQQGKGCVLIGMELRERGVDAYLISHLIDVSDSAWFALARDVRIKRFKQMPIDAREKAKQMRFLHSRGFSSRQIQAAFNNENDE
jgi:regulatory protein